jgi:hypothetical protein
MDAQKPTEKELLNGLLDELIDKGHSKAYA